MVLTLAPLPSELREPVSARSLPDGALNAMRRALASLGGTDEVDEDAAKTFSSDDGDAEEEEGHEKTKKTIGRGKSSLSSSAASPSIVSALAAAELRRETQLWERMMYKSASQHRRAVHFQRMRGVTRHIRALSALDVGAAALALRDGLRAGVSEDARAAALASPAVAAGAHALWKLPPRALWEDLARRLRAAAEVAAEADEALLAAAVALSGQLAHTYFMPFALIATASVARLRASLHQLVVDVVSSYNVLAPLLNGGVMPPPALLPRGENEEQHQLPESLRCEWTPVTVPVPVPCAATMPKPVATGGGKDKWKQSQFTSSSALRPTLCTVQASSSMMGMIDDEDWHWRLLHRAVEPTGVGHGPVRGMNGGGGGKGGESHARAETGARVGATIEDLGAAIPRHVRGLTAQLDRGDIDGDGGGKGSNCVKGSVKGGGSERPREDTSGEDIDGGDEEQEAGPAYSRVSFGLGLGVGHQGAIITESKSKKNTPVGTAAGDAPPWKPKANKLSSTEKVLTPDPAAPAPLPMMSIASLTSALKPQAVPDILQSASGGKKRRRPKGSGGGMESAAMGVSGGMAGGATRVEAKGAPDSAWNPEPREEGLHAKKKKKKKCIGGNNTQGTGTSSAEGASKPQSAVDRALSLLMGGK